MPDGRVKHIHVVAHATRNETGGVDFVGASDGPSLSQKRRRTGFDSRRPSASSSSSGCASRRKMEAVGAGSPAASHTNFNNVLAGVFAYGEMIFEGDARDSRSSAMRRDVLTAATRGRALVEQDPRVQPQQLGKRVPVDVTHVVAETLELLRGSLPANIGLESRAPGVASHRDRRCHPVHQVVMNVCKQTRSKP